jgi:hypothetical protein
MNKNSISKSDWLARAELLAGTQASLSTTTFRIALELTKPVQWVVCTPSYE